MQSLGNLYVLLQMFLLRLLYSTDVDELGLESYLGSR